MIDLQGKFPVIRLTMEAPTITSKVQLVKAFARSLKNVFVKHKYILESNKKEFLIDECMLMKKYLLKSESEITWDDIGVSLNYLITALHMHYNRKVVLLIDEYDKIITSLYSERSEYFSDAVNLFKYLVHQIKNNEKLLFTVFAGVTRLAKAGIFSDLNHLYHDSVVNSELSEYFGFTEPEVNSLLKKLIELKPGLSQMEVKKLITEWYNGYKIGNQTIYNPWSMMHCFDSLHMEKERPYSRYWIDSGSTELIEDAIMKIPKTECIEDLIKYGKTRVNYEGSFRYEDIETNENSLMLLLLHAGYITNFKDSFCKIPNYEIKTYFFENFIKAWLKKRIPESDISLVLKSFEDIQKYGDEFQNEFLNKMFKENLNESFFQTLVVIPFVFKSNIQPKHKIYIEKQTEVKTRIDILLTPKKEDSNSVFLLELEKVETSRSISAMVNEALLQVFNKKYADYVLENAELPENNHWKSFNIRIIVFSPDDLDTKWTIAIKELTFSKEKLRTKCRNFEILKQKNKDAKEELIEFLLSDPDSVSEYPSKLSS